MPGCLTERLIAPRNGCRMHPDAPWITESVCFSSLSLFSIVDAPVKMIVGLGNPGRTYEDTRHNAGFMVLDRLAARWGTVFQADRQRKCEVAAGPGVLLVKPSTFMNESGLCVGPMMRFFKLDPRSVFVIHDEVDFPLGVIKLREKGSAGGHNGIKSLIAHMGTQEFPRLRFGIGQPRGKGEMIGHVLGKFRPEERELLDVMLGKAEDAVLYTMEHGITRAGNIFNAVPG